MIPTRREGSKMKPPRERAICVFDFESIPVSTSGGVTMAWDVAIVHVACDGRGSST